jgi:hypothetical protein
MLIKGKIKKTYFLLYILPLVFTGGLAAYFLSILVADEHWDIAQLIIVLMLLSVGIFALRHILRVRNVIFDDKKVTVIDLRGETKKEFIYDSIKSIVEEESKGKGGVLSYKLVIDLGDYKVKLPQDAYHNYNEIKNALRDKVKGGIHTVEEKTNWAGIVIVVIFIAIIFGYKLFTKQKSYTVHDVIELGFVQNNKPYLHEYKSGKSTHYDIIFTLEKYHGFIFTIDGPAYKRMDIKSYLNIVNVGDTLTVMILRDEYETKLAKTKEASFIEKHDNYSNIEVVGLRKDNIRFLALEDVESENILQNGTNMFWALAIIAIVGCVGVLGYYNYKNPY